ncbi:MAG: hypothetical protein U0U69_01105 [Acidimicrobiia bacterium]
MVEHYFPEDDGRVDCGTGETSSGTEPGGWIDDYYSTVDSGG